MTNFPIYANEEFHLLYINLYVTYKSNITLIIKHKHISL